MREKRQERKKRIAIEIHGVSVQIIVQEKKGHEGRQLDTLSPNKSSLGAICVELKKR